MVMDSTYNGFRVVYATENAVTEKRFREIRPGSISVKGSNA